MKVPAHVAGRFLNLLRQAGIEVEERDLGPFSLDHDDDPFYHYAIVGRADAMATDNIGDFPPVPDRKRPEILTPSAAVAQLWRTEAPRGRGQGRSWS